MQSTEEIVVETVDFDELARLLEEALESGNASSNEPQATVSTSSVETLRLEQLPRELGVLLTSVGVLGFVLPGIAGTPALIAGGLVLWPKTFRKVENWVSHRFPGVHRKGMEQVGRFLDDLDRRYPSTDPTAG